METDELDAIQVAAFDAARALNVPYRTLLRWLDDGDIAGTQTLTGRRFTTVGAIRAFLATRGPAGEAALPGLEEYVRRYVLPREKGGEVVSTKVLSPA